MNSPHRAAHRIPSSFKSRAVARVIAAALSPVLPALGTGAILMSAPMAWADGGSGGNGAAGGVGIDGAAGSAASAAADGGGGGAAGLTGGAGGGSGSSVGGVGGTSSLPNGQSGASNSSGLIGGGGGGGGAHASVPTTLANAANLAGGNGGNGGNVSIPNATSVAAVGGGGGGAGGYGAISAGIASSNAASISGGAGGNGGQANLNSNYYSGNNSAVSSYTAAAGAGGSGGLGVALSSADAGLANAANASIAGGRGGDSSSNAQLYNYYSNTPAKSATTASTATSGAGGVGVQFANTNGSMTNLGSVSGGDSGNASTNAYVYQQAADGYAGFATAKAVGAAGGAGVQFLGTGSTLTNDSTGTIVGGNAGNTGASAQLQIYSNNGTAITGQLTSLAVAQSGRGGDGARFEAGGAIVNNAGSISGGRGGDASASSYAYNNYGGMASSNALVGRGGTGGDGVHAAADASVLNSGTITGGAAGGAQGNSYSFSTNGTPNASGNRVEAGTGGSGIDIASGSVTNLANGTIVGGLSSSYFYTQLYGSSFDSKAVFASAGAAGVGVTIGTGSVTNAGSIVGGGVQQYFQSYDELYSGNQQVADGATVANQLTNVATSAAGGAGIRMGGGAVLNQASGVIRGGDLLNSGAVRPYAILQPSNGLNNVNGVSETDSLNINVTGGSAGRGVEVTGAGVVRNDGVIAGGQAGSSFGHYAQINAYTQNSGSKNSTVGALTATFTAGAGGDGVSAGGTSTVVNSGTVSGGLSANVVHGDANLSYSNYSSGGGSGNTIDVSGTVNTVGGSGGNAVLIGDAAKVTNSGALVGGNSTDTFTQTFNANNNSNQQTNGTVFTGKFNLGFQGGAGGNGALLNGGTLTNSGSVTGGNGGSIDLAGFSAQDNLGGSLAWSANAGAGGAGVRFTGTGAASVYNAAGGTLQGGDGGVVTGTANGAIAVTGLKPGAGGAGVSGANVNLSNAGTIQGGLGGDGARAPSIEFTGGTNKLTIEAGSNIVGNVQAFSRADTFGLGGAVDASFDISQIGDAAKYRGFGEFEKTGTSKWTLTGASADAVDFVVRGGRLANNASLPNTEVTVVSGGTLAGNGTVGGISALAGSIVAPGNSIGTLNVNGNYAAAAGSIYQVEYDGVASDLIKATGTATIASGAGLQAIHYGTAPIPLNVRYTVVSADGGVSGKYTLSGETVASPFVTLHDTYDANHVYLEAVQSASLVPGATGSVALISGYTTNQINTGFAAQGLAITNGLRQALLFQPTVAAARAGFDQISGESHASAKTVLLEDSRFVREAATDRLLGAFCAPGAGTLATGSAATPACAPDSGTLTWGKIFGSTGRIKGDGNAQQAERDIGGIVVGADALVGGGWRVGGLAGYSRSDMDNVRSSSVKTDDCTLGAYGGNQWNKTSLRLGASYTWHKLDTKRTVAFTGFADSLSAKYDASTSQVFGELGQRFDIGRVALEPFAGLAYVNVKTDAFGERGGVAALRGASGSTDVTFGTLGLRASSEVSDGLRLRGMVGWRHAFSAVTPSSTNAFAGGSAFTVYGVPIARNVAVVEAGLETTLRPNLTLGASYSGQFGSGLKDNGFKVTLGMKF